MSAASCSYSAPGCAAAHTCHAAQVRSSRGRSSAPLMPAHASSFELQKERLLLGGEARLLKRLCAGAVLQNKEYAAIDLFD